MKIKKGDFVWINNKKEKVKFLEKEGGHKIEIDDFGNEEDCTWCNGTGLVSKNL